MRRYHCLLPLFTLALTLAGCAPQGATGPTPAPTTSAPLAVDPTSAPPTASAPTRVPATVAPTNAPPTLAPTLAPTTAPPTLAPTSAPTLAPTSAPTLAPTSAPTLNAEQIFFLRGGDLVALDVGAGNVELLVEGVREVAATRDARRLILVRGDGVAGELWVLERSSGSLWQLTQNTRAESTPSWALDGLSLVYSSAPEPRPFPPDWERWSGWCGSAEARLLDLPATPQLVAASAERSLGPGCEPAFGPDGKRIVFTTPPTGAGGMPFKGAGNTLRMVNRQGENGWDMAIADGVTPEQGQLVYSPAWSPDGGQISYQRFLGYQALVDINLVEVGSSFQRNGAPVGLGAGWMLAPSFAPDGRQMLITEHNYSDARGLSGYNIWRTTVLRLGAPSQLMLPSGELTLGASEAARLPQATAAAWSPDGAALIVALPAGWQPGMGDDEPSFAAVGPGELWRWRVGAAPEAKLADGVDFGSPLLWLPAAPGSLSTDATDFRPIAGRS